MKNVYTPSKSDVERAWFLLRLRENPDMKIDPDSSDADDEFDRFIAKVKASALRELSDQVIEGATAVGFSDHERADISQLLDYKAWELGDRA